MLSRLKLEEGWFTLLLVWGLVIVSAATILDAELMDGLEYLPLIATASVFTGVLLAKSRFSSRTAHIFSLIYGLALLTYILGSMLPDSMTWLERIFDLVERQYVWITKAFSQGSSRDGLIFVIHTSAVFWLLGYTAAWYTFRELSPSKTYGVNSSAFPFARFRPLAGARRLWARFCLATPCRDLDNVLHMAV
jgi:hypothetical protein